MFKIISLYFKNFYSIFCIGGMLMSAHSSTVLAASLHSPVDRPSLEIAGTRTLPNGKRIIVGIGDIEKIENVDAIVNAANDNLIFGSGIAGAIAQALGPQGVQQVYNQINTHYTTPRIDRIRNPNTCPGIYKACENRV